VWHGIWPGITQGALSVMALNGVPPVAQADQGIPVGGGGAVAGSQSSTSKT